MLTKKDLLGLEDIFVTRPEFEEAIAETKENTLRYKDDLLTQFNSVKLETEIARGYRGMIADLEERVEKVELECLSVHKNT